MGNGRLLHDRLTPLQPLNSSPCVVFCCFSRFKSIYLAPLEITRICYFSLLDSVALIGYLDNGIFLTFCVQKWWIDCCYTFLFCLSSVPFYILPFEKQKLRNRIQWKESWFLSRFLPSPKYRIYFPTVNIVFFEFTYFKLFSST